MLQTEIVFFRNAAAPIIGAASGAQYAFPGAALTASTAKLWFNLISQGSIIAARWVLAWNPKTGASPTGVRLVYFDDGPANIVQIGEITSTNYSTPRVDAVWVTTYLQNLLASRVERNFGHQTFGNGVNGPSIYSSALEIVWG